MDWFYALNDRHVGPLDDKAMEALILSKVISRSTLVWNSAMPEWLPAIRSDLAPLFPEDVRSAPPPLPRSGTLSNHGKPKTTSQKSKVTAGLLGIFLGGFGIHRFYLGYGAIGAVQIVVTLLTFGLGSLWGLIEGIMILAGNIDRDADGEVLGP